MLICDLLFIVTFLRLVLTNGNSYEKSTHLQSKHDVVLTKHNLARTKRYIEPQISGGDIKTVKSAVSIWIKENNNKDPICSGTLISNTWVITAGHCVKDVNLTNILVVAAEMNILRYIRGQSQIAIENGVRNVRIHPKYFVIPNQLYDWDIALLELDNSIVISSNPDIEIALLPPPSIKHSGKKIRVGGWGKTGFWLPRSAEHKAIEVIINEDNECEKIFRDVGDFFVARMFCAGRMGKTTCTGDSGAGAIFNDWGFPIVLGIVSFGSRCSTASGYPKIEKALDWIYNETEIR